MASRGVNKVILVGHLGQDPEVRYMPNGGAVANITLATSESWRDKATGEQKEKTEWHRVVLFGKLAEIAGEYLRKGSQVYIEGSLQTRKWTDQAGVEKYTTEIVVNIGGTLQMLGGVRNLPTQDNQARAVGGNLSNRNLRTAVRRLSNPSQLNRVEMPRRWILTMTYRSLGLVTVSQNQPFTLCDCRETLCRQFLE